MGHRAALGPDVVNRVLDDVERRRFLVEPARKDPAELAVRAAHVELDEGAGKLLDLPGRGGLAGAQPHDHVADPDRLAGPQRQVAREAVALVEQAEHRDPLGHRRRAGREPGHGLRARRPSGSRSRPRSAGSASSAPRGRAGGERERRRQAQAGGEAAHRSVGRPGLIVAARRLAPAALLERAGRAIGRRPCRSGSASRLCRNLGGGGSASSGSAVDLAGQPGIPFGRHAADVVGARIHHPAAAPCPRNRGCRAASSPTLRPFFQLNKAVPSVAPSHQVNRFLKKPMAERLAPMGRTRKLSSCRLQASRRRCRQQIDDPAERPEQQDRRRRGTGSGSRSSASTPRRHSRGNTSDAADDPDQPDRRRDLSRPSRARTATWTAGRSGSHSSVLTCARSVRSSTGSPVVAGGFDPGLAPGPRDLERHPEIDQQRHQSDDRDIGVRAHLPSRIPASSRSLMRARA